MKRINLLKTLLVGTFVLAFASTVSANLNLKRKYRADEYIPEENAYFGGEITDPAGHIKAHKYVTPTDDQYTNQKTRSLGTSLIGDIESVWSSYTGKGTTIAVIDDGFDYDHPEYTRSDGTSAILSTSRYYYASGNSYNYKKYSDDPTCIAEDWESAGNNKYEWATHGTATSTTAAAPMNNGGGVGIAPETDILALKIDFSFASIDGAIRYAVSQGVDVINMSLGAYAETFTDGWGDEQEGYSSTATYLNSACQAAYNAGIIVVAAAGNESTWHKSYPACNSHVIGVGAIGDWDNKGNANKLAEFTNYVGSSQTGEINVDILAPGYVYTAEQTVSSSSHVNYSSKPSSHSHTYDDTQGTSFSCPIIAGAACLWKQKNPNGTPDDFLAQLQSTADGIGYYQNKMIEVSGWYSNLTDVGPSNITNGRLNVANLLDINEPYVSTLQNSLSISVGEKRQIELDTYNGTITYSSNNPSVATVTNSGLVEGKSAGNTGIIVTATKNGHTATATVNVHVDAAIAATSISFDPNSISLSIGDTYDAETTLSVTPSNASRIFLFESEDESVASVNEDTGLITAIAPGETTINAVAGFGTGYDSLSVTVNAPTTPTSWEKVTNDNDITNGDYLIVYEDGNLAFNGGLSTLDATFNTISVSISNNKITWSNNTDAAKFTINTITGGYSIKSASGYYIGRETNSNGIDSSTSQAYVNTISISSGNATITGSGGKIICFNTASNQSRFRYMTSGGSVQLYKASNSSSTPTPTVTSVTVSPSALSLDKYNNKTGNLTASVVGTNSPSQSVTWSTSNSSVATVNNGAVTAIGVGTTIITATSTVDATKQGTCTVTVTDSTPKTLSSITISGQTTSLEVGSEFSFGGTVTAHFSDSSTSDVTSSATFSGYNMSVAGSYTVTVSYTYGSVTKTTTYTLNITSSGGSGGTVSRTYTIGWGNATGATGTYSNFTSTSGNVQDLLGFSCNQNNSNNAPAYYSPELRLYYNSSGNGGYITIVPVEGITFTGFVVTATQSYTPTIKYSIDGGSLTSINHSNNAYTVTGFSATESLRIQNGHTSNTQLRIQTICLTYEVPDESDKIVSSLTATYSGGDLFVNDSLDQTKVSVTARYTNSSKYPDSVLNSEDYSLTGFSSMTAGQKTVTVTYIGSLDTVVSPLTTTFSVNVIEDTVQSVSVTNTKTYHPGETISKSDISVTLTYLSGSIITTNDFAFDDSGYQFKYDDAISGGANTQKQFSVKYAGNPYNFSVNVNRNTYQTISPSTTTLSSTQFGSSDLSDNINTPSASIVNIGGMRFSVTTNAYVFTTNNVNYISFGKAAGSISNTDPFNSSLTSVSVTQKSGARQDGVLRISKDHLTWVDYSTSEISKGGYVYFKYEYTTGSNASGASSYSNIEKIVFTTSGQDNAVNVSNYIMFEDTEGQCLNKLTPAINKLNSMSDSEKNNFWNSDDYVISTARARLTAWALHERKTLSFNDGLFSANSSKNVILLPNISQNNTLCVLIVISVLGLASFSTYLFIRHRKEQD